MRTKRHACRILVVNPEGKSPLERPRRKWVDNVKMVVRGIVWSGMDLIVVAHDRER
jgi:hypothetical protein